MAETRYHHGDLEQAILETAKQMLEQSGIAELSLRDIAKHIGVSHQAPYKHFASKADVLLAIPAKGFKDSIATQKAKRLIALTQGNVALESQAVSAASAQEHLEA
ncbi:MAG: TetR/AcrR family transcriptional regulator, partial [Planctomycetota bacterium]